MCNDKYYVQRLARQSAMQIKPITDNLQIPYKHLNGISNDEFIMAFHTYHNILHQIYNDVQLNPDSFGMVCLEIENNVTGQEFNQMGPVKNDEAKSRKSFFRLPNTLYTLACVGKLTGDGLLVNTEDFLKFNDGKTGMKMSNVEIIFERLCDYGFEFEEMPDGYKFKQTDSFMIYYPDEKNVLVVLKAFACVHGFEKFISADYRNLLSEKSDNIVYELNDVSRLLKSQTDRQLVQSIYKKLENQGYFSRIEYQGFWAKIRFARSKSKKEFLVIDVDRDYSLHIPVRLQNIAQYADKLDLLSLNILRQTLSGRDCCDCGYCNNSIGFTYNGKAYRKCAIICCGFFYMDFTEKDIPSLLQLIDWELEC